MSAASVVTYGSAPKLPFEKFFKDDTRRGTKIPQGDYCAVGKYPVVDQGERDIAGFSNGEDGVYRDVPVVIFGDHTRAVKFVDRPFYLGADGVKVLKPADGIFPRYAYYALKAARITSLGYSRHFKLLKELTFTFNTWDRQYEIASVLDRICALKRNAEAQLAQLKLLAKSRFVEMFPEGKCQTVKAGEVLNGLRNGLSPSTHGQYRGNVLTLTSVTQGRFDPTYYKEGMFDIPPPQDKLVSSKDFYICRGNGNKSLVGVGVFSENDRPDLIFPDTVIAATVDFSKICLPYLFYAWRMPNARQQIEKGAKTTNGTYKINQKLIESIEIPLPPLSAQKEFAAFIQQLDKSSFAVNKLIEQYDLLYRAKLQEYFG